ncbi:hypothetical protein AAFF_G00328520 [Aldrovandia affinis]|uniref:Uncharacterized protein n=1 Tax=Aldrovandia affinis TaxID=143900 RepID=A0AAD7T9P4_9TELE|nr:hypothetical protein AAFF_G00328520 [Aldrovandia affinis]
MVTVDKCIRVYPNQKPWMNREVQQLVKERNSAFRAGDRAHYSTARANLKRGIREAKADYRRKIEDHLDSNNSRQVWQGVQHITNYKTNFGAAEGDASLAEELNLFFARFEVEPPEATPHPMVHSSTTLTVEEHEGCFLLSPCHFHGYEPADFIPETVIVLKSCKRKDIIVSWLTSRHEYRNRPSTTETWRNTELSGIFETDSEYVKLAKQGGQKGLLWHEETNLENKPNSQYKPPDWFSASDKQQQSPSTARSPDLMTPEEDSPSKEAILRPDAPFGSDNKSTWEREADGFTSGKEKKIRVDNAADEMEKMSLNYQDVNKYKRTCYDKKPVPVSMSKLLSFGYVEEEKSPNDDDESSVTSDPASSFAPEEDLE